VHSKVCQVDEASAISETQATGSVRPLTRWSIRLPLRKFVICCRSGC
jgi:hypothetical protein